MKTYLVDIDGTLADLSHRLHWIEGEQKDWDRFFAACVDDLPIQEVIEVVQAIGFLGWHNDNVQVVYLTGRPERVRRETIAWLLKHSLPKGELLMRQDGDHRPDTETKPELLQHLRRRGDRVVGVFEDRPAVCRVWRELGLTVFQVADKEF